MKAKITQALVERAPYAERGKPVLYADPELRGFYLIVTATKRAYYVQSLVNGKQVRAKLGQDHATFLGLDFAPGAHGAGVAGPYGAAGSMQSAGFTTPIKAFHLTNPIARASRTMAECAELAAGVNPAVAAE